MKGLQSCKLFALKVCAAIGLVAAMDGLWSASLNAKGGTKGLVFLNDDLKGPNVASGFKLKTSGFFFSGSLATGGKGIGGSALGMNQIALIVPKPKMGCGYVSDAI
jgi:hypothetical protein